MIRYSTTVSSETIRMLEYTPFEINNNPQKYYCTSTEPLENSCWDTTQDLSRLLQIEQKLF